MSNAPPSTTKPIWGAYSGHDLLGLERELAEVVALVEALAPAKVLDVGCGTGFITRHLTVGSVFLDPWRNCSHESVFGGPQAEGVGRSRPWDAPRRFFLTGVQKVGIGTS